MSSVPRCWRLTSTNADSSPHDELIRPRRHARNATAHRQRLTHEESVFIEAADILSKLGEDVPREFFQQRTNRFVQRRKSEITAFNAQLLELVERIFSEMAADVETRYAVLSR
jgi:hypothetical protein